MGAKTCYFLLRPVEPTKRLTPWNRFGVFRRHLRGIGHVEMHRSLDELLGLEAHRGADVAHPTVI